MCPGKKNEALSREPFSQNKLSFKKNYKWHPKQISDSMNWPRILKLRSTLWFSLTYFVIISPLPPTCIIAFFFFNIAVNHLPRKLTICFDPSAYVPAFCLLFSFILLFLLCPIYVAVSFVSVQLIQLFIL